MPLIPSFASGTLFGVALNFKGLLAQHWVAFHQAPYHQPPSQPVLFIKTPNTRNSDGGVIVRPQGKRLQAGPALGVIIGTQARRESIHSAMERVGAYTIINEFSLPEDSYFRPALKAKCRDGFCAIGPQPVPPEQVQDPGNLGLRLYVNGQLRQENTTRNWVHSLAELITNLSAFMTLNPGDILITGTPEGRVDLVSGDQVAVEIDGLGTLHTSVVDETTE